RLSQPIPRVKPASQVKPRIEPDLGVPPRPASEPVRRAEVLRLDPWRKGRTPWQVVPADKATSYVVNEPSAVEKEIKRAVGEAARSRRMRALSDPMNLYGGDAETIEDVVKRQDETR